MQLDPDEISIMTYFNSEDEAISILQSLKNEGFHDVQLSHVSEFPWHNIYSNNQNISTKILGSGSYDYDHGPLLAADPSVSGISSQAGPGLVSSYLITVVTHNDRLEKVNLILKTTRL